MNNKTNESMKPNPIITLALAAVITSTAFAGFNAPLPEFKTPKQLAEWRAEMAAKSQAKTTATQETAFYTGKPYLASSGNYAFKFRSYSPELARWTSEDPSGFPDGANVNAYIPCPTSGFDYMGLFYAGTSYSTSISDMALWTALKAGPYILAVTALDHADGTIPGDWTLNSNETNMIKQNSGYQFDYTRQVINEVSSLAFGAISTKMVHYAFPKYSDAYYAFGHADLATSGQKTSTFAGEAWGYDATVTLADDYSYLRYATVGAYTPTALGYRLESHGYIKEFKISGTWNDKFFGSE
jgi:RHS repeat-associated protein